MEVAREMFWKALIKPKSDISAAYYVQVTPTYLSMNCNAMFCNLNLAASLCLLWKLMTRIE